MSPIRPLKLVCNLPHSMPAWHMVQAGLDKLFIEQATHSLKKWSIVVARDDAHLAEQLATADALWCWSAPPNVATLAPRLKWVSTPSAGADYVRGLPEHVTFTTSHGYHGIPMAEYVLGALLKSSRRFDAMDGCRVGRRGGPPSYDELRGAAQGADDLYGKTLCIVGCGSIGLHLAWRASAMGMRVVGVRRSGAAPRLSSLEALFLPPAALASVSAWATPSERAAFLPEADVVVNILPGSAASRGWFDDEAFALFKPGSTFVNVGRGSTVDQAALLRALDRGAPARAVLDVTEAEPLSLQTQPPADGRAGSLSPPRVSYAPADHPVIAHPAVYATPHVSAYTPNYLRWGITAQIHQMRLAEEGRPLEHVHRGPRAPFAP